ncbi:major facilitator superfamily transporter [Metarhizium robertsii ARSEF 23]|uniref:Major facilitator superfamily transporter n=2 Tax=Metarhizium robertsii TaxID=568076 RepID=E9FCE1_METRA|nr:major facilitator superfamily transporter [Metarhizium robertsii ARSEF 23]EFY94569.1 major facilitator superfamily transporter [Metarhizium robertsii ARSEF 23]
MSLQEKDNTPLGEWPPGDATPRQTPAQTPSKVSEESHHGSRHGHIHDDDDLEDHTQDRVQRPQSLAAEVLFIAVICSSQLLAQAGLALSIVPQHIIARSFGIENQPGEVSWFSAAYSLTVGTFILIAGRLGDVFGHKRFFVGGFAWYGLWSALAGVAVYSGPVFFAFCRAMQGIGPAFLLPNSIAIIGRCYDPGLRQNMIFSLFGATAPSGFLLGAVFASLLSQMAWWPWAYWVMCFACLLLALLGVFAIPATPPPTNPEHEGSSAWQRVDVFGSVTGVAALALFNFAWNQGPVVGWPTPYTYFTMIIGILIFVIFVLVEKRVRHPLIPFGVLKIDSLFTLACVSAGWASFGIFVYYIWNFLMVLRGQTPLYTSAQFAPIAISGLLAAVTTGLALSHLRPSTVMLISMTAFLVGGIIFATVPVHQTYWAQTFVSVIVFPWGMDMSFPAATIVLSRAMPRRHQGLAASLVNTFVNYSISIGLGFAGTVDSQVSDGGKNVLRGYRGAFYMGIGLSSLGVVVALIFCFLERRRSNVSEEIAGGSSQMEVELT